MSAQCDMRFWSMATHSYSRCENKAVSGYGSAFRNYCASCSPRRRLEIETVTIQAAEDAIEDAVAAHDFNALASIAHTLRITLEAERTR